MDLQKQRRSRYQNGTLVRLKRKKGSDVWIFRYYEITPEGRRTRPQVTVGTLDQYPTRRAALQASEGLRLRANREIDAHRPVSMAALLNRYERECVDPFVDVPVGAEDNRKPSVQCARTYKSVMRKWIRPRWTTVHDKKTGRVVREYRVADFQSVTLSAAIEEWLSSVMKSSDNPDGLAPKSVRGVFNVMKLIFKRAVKWGYLSRSPMGNKFEKLVELPAGSTKRQAKPRSLSPDEYLELVQLYGPRERAAIEISGWLWTRRSEGFGLKWEDIDFTARVVSFRRGFVNGRITQLKTEASRTNQPMPDDVVNALLAWRSITPYRAPSDWVFASPQRQGRLPLWPGQLLKTHIKPLAEKNGFGKIGWHTFRHSGSSWGKATLQPEERKELLRHENLKTTDLYGEMPMEAKRAAQERVVEYVKAAAKAAQAQKEALVAARPVTATVQ